VSDVTETDTAEEILEAPEESEVRSTGQLEEEGEIAADYIEELLDIADLDGDIEIDTRRARTPTCASLRSRTPSTRCRSSPALPSKPRPDRSHG
jgi:hypothetical protein